MGGKGLSRMRSLIPPGHLWILSLFEEILGVKGQMANGVYKVTIGRTTNARPRGR